MVFINRWQILPALLLSAGLLALPARATEITPDDAAISAICDAVSAAAARAENMPADALYAITLTETGRSRGGKLRPWPWTVNMEGKGFWFDTREEALAYVTERYNAGARSFDVGCFQINYKWHGMNFESIEAMFDPMTNATYAAQMLSGLYGEFGDWTKAAGAYHSRTETYASRYRTRYARIRARLGGEAPAPVLRLPTVQPNVQVARFPEVRHAFFSGPPITGVSPYSSRAGAIGDGAIPVPASVMGSLASGMLGGATVTLLTSSSGALF
ncbi:MAG: transglycosylase SLT domain-containing protein [Rhodobacteraceae bacterium]|nr:transglycosylase SLT domain-containing protein [Paracoccaceae bacterium]